MKIGMMYAMDGEIESLLKNENAHFLEKVAGASFYQIREDVVACAGGVGKVNAAMSAGGLRRRRGQGERRHVRPAAHQPLSARRGAE